MSPVLLKQTLNKWGCSTSLHGPETYFFQISGFEKPMLFQSETPMKQFVAYIDPDNKFCKEDKLSQVFNIESIKIKIVSIKI